MPIRPPAQGGGERKRRVRQRQTPLSTTPAGICPKIQRGVGRLRGPPPSPRPLHGGQFVAVFLFAPKGRERSSLSVRKWRGVPSVVAVASDARRALTSAATSPPPSPNVAVWGTALAAVWAQRGRPAKRRKRDGGDNGCGGGGGGGDGKPGARGTAIVLLPQDRDRTVAAATDRRPRPTAAAATVAPPCRPLHLATPATAKGRGGRRDGRALVTEAARQACVMPTAGQPPAQGRRRP